MSDLTKLAREYAQACDLLDAKQALVDAALERRDEAATSLQIARDALTAEAKARDVKETAVNIGDGRVVLVRHYTPNHNIVPLALE